jgi:hypothetical protein
MVDWELADANRSTRKQTCSTIIRYKSYMDSLGIEPEPSRLKVEDKTAWIMAKPNQDFYSY